MGTMINRRRVMGGSRFIKFADPVVKSICVTRWGGATGGNAPISTYVDGVRVEGVEGEMTYEQAASVKNLNGYFSGKTNIVAFNELYYFTNITAFIGRDFRSCSNLQEIRLPKNIQNLSYETFVGTNLKEVTIPETVTSADVTYLFSRCYSLKKMTVLTSLIQNFWSSCPAIEELVFGDSVTTLPERSCKKNTIGKIVWGRNMYNIQYEALSDRSYTSFGGKIVIPSTISVIGDNAFSRVTELTDIFFLCPNPTNYDTRIFGSAGPTGIENIWVHDDAYDYFYNRYGTSVRTKLKRLSDYPNELFF